MRARRRPSSFVAGVALVIVIIVMGLAASTSSCSAFRAGEAPSVDGGGIADTSSSVPPPDSTANAEASTVDSGIKSVLPDGGCGIAPCSGLVCPVGDIRLCDDFERQSPAEPPWFANEMPASIVNGCSGRALASSLPASSDSAERDSRLSAKFNTTRTVAIVELDAFIDYNSSVVAGASGEIFAIGARGSSEEPYGLVLVAFGQSGVILRVRETSPAVDDTITLFPLKAWVHMKMRIAFGQATGHISIDLDGCNVYDRGTPTLSGAGFDHFNTAIGAYANEPTPAITMKFDNYSIVFE